MLFHLAEAQPFWTTNAGHILLAHSALNARRLIPLCALPKSSRTIVTGRLARVISGYLLIDFNRGSPHIFHKDIACR